MWNSRQRKSYVRRNGGYVSVLTDMPKLDWVELGAVLTLLGAVSVLFGTLGL